jgi:hypothetical protein
LHERAREAAVGEKRPVTGVLGRWLGLVVMFEGVLGLDGVLVTWHAEEETVN